MIGNILTMPGGRREAEVGSGALHRATAHSGDECAQSQRLCKSVKEVTDSDTTSITCHNTAANAQENEVKVEQKPHFHHKLHTVTPAM